LLQVSIEPCQKGRYLSSDWKEVSRVKTDPTVRAEIMILFLFFSLIGETLKTDDNEEDDSLMVLMRIGWKP